MSDFDVVVVGGRVAGASTALLLARSGVRVALLDRGSYGSDTLSTHGLMRAGVWQLNRWGVLPSLVAAGTPPILRTAFHYADGESVEVALRPTAGVEALYAPRRLLLDRLLVDAAASAGVEVRHETTVTSPNFEGDRVVGVRARDEQGRAQTIRATVTVGADGVHSTVATQIGAPVVWRARSAGAVLYRYYADLPTIGYEWAYGAGVAAGLIPTNDGLTCVFVGTAPPRMRELRRQGVADAFATILGEAFPALPARVATAVPAGRLQGWPAVRGFGVAARGRAGRLSVMRAITRTPSPPMASPTGSGTPSCSPTRSWTCWVAGSPSRRRSRNTSPRATGCPPRCSRRPRRSRRTTGTPTRCARCYGRSAPRWPTSWNCCPVSSGAWARSSPRESLAREELFSSANGRCPGRQWASMPMGSGRRPASGPHLG